MTIRPFLLLLYFAAASLSAAEMSEAEKLLAMPLEGAEASMEPDDIGAAIPSLDCLLTPSVDTQIASPVLGVIKSVLVEKGDLVKKGDVLFRLRSEVEEATLALNQAQTEYGERTIERNTGLYQRNLISEQEKDEIIINNRLYGYEMEQTRALLRQKTITSPLTGVVVETFLDPGEYVGEEPVMQVVQLDPLYVEVVVPASYFGRIAKGEQADVTLDAPLNSTHKAKVRIVDRVLDAASGTFGVRLELPNPGYHLPAGLKCGIRFASNEVVRR